MYRYITYRVYPNKKQKVLIRRTLRCCTLVWNLGVIEMREREKAKMPHLDENQMIRKIAEWVDDYPFLAYEDQYTLASVIHDLYQSVSKRRPKFKKSKRCYRVMTGRDGALVTFDFIEVPELGYIRYRQGKRPDGYGRRMVVKSLSNGEYYIQILESVSLPAKQNQGGVIGIDLGLMDFIVTSDGLRIPAPDYLGGKSERLKRLYRELARRNKRSKNYQKTVKKIQQEYLIITRKRTDYLVKTAISLVSENAIICIEGLDIKGMNKKHSVARKEVILAWGEFVQWLETKAMEYGTKIIKIDRYYPSSQICSKCGARNITLRDYTIKKWTCCQCNYQFDRDLNAAINIRNEGLRLLDSR